MRSVNRSMSFAAKTSLEDRFESCNLNFAVEPRAYVWELWKIGAMTSARKLIESPARLRLDRIEPFSG